MHQFNRELSIVQDVIAHPTQSVRGAVTMALITNDSAGKLPNFDSNTKQMIFGVCLCFLHVHLVLPIVLLHASPLDG